MKIRVGLIGAGKRALVYRKPLRMLGEDGRLEWVGICTRDQSKSEKEIRSEFGMSPVPIDELVAKSDALIICVPARSTITLAEDCLIKGKHLFLETPLTGDEHTLVQLNRQASAAKRIVEVAHNLGESPEIVFLRRLQRELRWGALRRFSNHGRITDYHALAIASLFDGCNSVMSSRPKARFEKAQSIETQSLTYSNGFQYLSVRNFLPSKSPSRGYFEFEFEKTIISDGTISVPNEKLTRYSLEKVGENAVSFGEALIKKISVSDSEGVALSEFAIPEALSNLTEHEIGLIRQLSNFCSSIEAKESGKCSIGLARAVSVVRSLKRMSLAKRLPFFLGYALNDHWVDRLITIKGGCGKILKRKMTSE